MRILLDLDSTDDPTHGKQEGTRYHGYYRQHMYHPLLIFDGDTDQLITAVLRPGNAHAGTGHRRDSHADRPPAAGDAWPAVVIAIRADAGFAVPALYDYCDAEGIELTIALLHNTRLAAAGGRAACRSGAAIHPRRWVRRCDCALRRSIRQRVGRIPAAWSTKRRRNCCRRGRWARTSVLSSPVGTIRPKRSTIGTPRGAGQKAGSRTSRTMSDATA